MKKQIYLTALAFITIFVMALSACAPAAGVPAVQAGGSDKAQAAPVEFTGVIEAVNGNQLTVNGQTVVVDPQALAGVPVKVGDTIRVKGTVANDGAILAASVQLPQSAAVPGFAPAAAPGNAATTSNSSSSSSTSDSSSGSDSNASNSSDDENEVVGVVEAINGNQITINGVTYTVADGVDLSGIAVGDTIKIHFTANADGTFTVTEVQTGTDGSDSSSDDSSDDGEDVSSDDGSDASGSDDGSDDSSDDGSDDGSDASGNDSGNDSND